MHDLLNCWQVYLSHFRQDSPVINISLTMVLMLGYKSDCPHLQMNARSFPGHWSLSTSHWPGAQDKQLQSSSQFMLSTLGNVKVPRRAESKLPRSNFPVISVILFDLYLFCRQDSLFFEQTPNVQCPVAISSAYRRRNITFLTLKYWLNELWFRIAISIFLTVRLRKSQGPPLEHPRLSFTVIAKTNA